ncbi:hypothetical protein AXF42_Ash014931 [Apostasia shenzhenica]|uniref:Reverse transcriptase RNase H-like domain-containing protein n=1 Tax=Apostasia shenzhenica TaxID=1088818 RepID=A0A2I0ALI6_9ASPA|nr:hypothetical protein AXF42_Ash014931 [Apostasia shenzhenica]
MCDTSNYALGAVLGQRIDNKSYVIHYASHTLNEAQLNYTVTEKEFLAVVFAFEKFRSYLLGSQIIVYTDYSALKYLLSKKVQNLDCCVEFSFYKNLIVKSEIEKDQQI